MLLLLLLSSLPLCYLGSLCVSPDDVDLSSAATAAALSRGSSNEHAPARLRVKVFKGNIHPNNNCSVENVVYMVRVVVTLLGY